MNASSQPRIEGCTHARGSCRNLIQPLNVVPGIFWPFLGITVYRCPCFGNFNTEFLGSKKNIQPLLKIKIATIDGEKIEDLAQSQNMTVEELEKTYMSGTRYAFVRRFEVTPRIRGHLIVGWFFVFDMGNPASIIDPSTYRPCPYPRSGPMFRPPAVGKKFGFRLELQRESFGSPTNRRPRLIHLKTGYVEHEIKVHAPGSVIDPKDMSQHGNDMQWALNPVLKIAGFSVIGDASLPAFWGYRFEYLSSGIPWYRYDDAGEVRVDEDGKFIRFLSVRTVPAPQGS